MKLEKGEISSSQLMFLVAGFIQGTEFSFALSDKLVKQTDWLAVLAALALSIPFALVYVALGQKFPGNNLIQIHDLIYGPYLGKSISVIYVMFFTWVGASWLRFVADFLMTYLMPETPLFVFLVMFTILCAYAVRKGIEVIARTSFLLVATTMLSVLLTFVLPLKDFKLANFLPVFEVPLKDFFQGTHMIVASTFCQAVVFLMVIPSLNKIKQARSSVLLGFVIAGGTLLIVSLRNRAILGALITITANPSLAAVRMIDIAHIITRLEVLVVIVLLQTVFLLVSVFYYATVLGTAQMLNLQSYLPLVLPIGIILIIVAMILAESSIDLGTFGTNIWSAYSFLFQVLLPSISLLIAKIRKLPNS